MTLSISPVISVYNAEDSLPLVPGKISTMIAEMIISLTRKRADLLHTIQTRHPEDHTQKDRYTTHD
jgi:hypothetical protein